MAFDVRISGEHAKVVLSGDVDLQTTAELKAEIQNISGVTRLEVEAADVTYIDSSGVAVLLLARQHCAGNNISLSLPTISEAVHRVLQIAKLDAMLPIGEVVQAADSGVMGLGGSDDAEAPTGDDELVNQLLADESDLAAGIMDSDDDAPAGDDTTAAGGDNFGGLDVSAVDFSQPADSPSSDSDDGEPQDEAVSDAPILPGTFS